MIVKWRLFHTISHRFLKNPYLKSFHESRFRCSARFELTTHIVESTLSNCPSDLIALSFFLWCGRQPNYFHDPRSFDRVVPIVSRVTDRLGSVKNVVEELASIGCATRAQTFLVLLRIYWRGGMYISALDAFEQMGCYGYVPNTYARNMIIDILFKIGRIDMALSVLRDTQLPNFLTFNIVIHNLCKLNDRLGVCNVLKAILREGFRPNLGTFAVVLNCFCKAGWRKGSLQVLGLMISLGNRPSVTIWSILIEGYCRAGRVDIASELLRKMVECGCHPNVVTYTSLVKRLFGARMFDRVFGVLNAMQSNGCAPDLVFYNVLIDCLCKVCRFDDAFEVFLGLRDVNLKPDSYTFSSLISILCSSGKLGLFSKLVAGIDVSVDLVVCNSFLNVLCKAGFPSEAVEYYQDMVDGGFIPDRYSYAGLLNGLCRAGRIGDAVNVYQGILASSPCTVDVHIHTVVFNGLIKEGNFHRAIKLFRKAIAKNYCLDVVSYTVAINGLFKGGKFEEAHSLFNQMEEAGIVPNICTYNVMLYGLCKVRDVNAVKRLLKNMGDAEIELDCVSYNIIIGFLSKSHRVHLAFQVFIKMYSLGWKLNKATYRLLVNGLYCVGEVDIAYQLLKVCTDDIVFMDRSCSEICDMGLPRNDILGMSHRPNEIPPRGT